MAEPSLGLVANATSSGTPALARRARSPARRSGTSSARSIKAGPFLRAGVSPEHADLTVLDPARRARVLPLHADGFAALLHDAGLVQHQHGTRIAQPLGDVGPQIVAGRSRVPAHPAQEVLHPPVGRGVTRGGRGRLPALDRAAIKSAPPALGAHAGRPARGWRRGSTRSKRGAIRAPSRSSSAAQPAPSSQAAMAQPSMTTHTTTETSAVVLEHLAG